MLIYRCIYAKGLKGFGQRTRVRLGGPIVGVSVLGVSVSGWALVWVSLVRALPAHHFRDGGRRRLEVEG